MPPFSRFEKMPVIIVAVPILNTLKEWMGTIAVAVPLSTINKKLSFMKLTKGSYAWLADANGMIVSHPDESFIMKVQLSTTNSDTLPRFWRHRPKNTVRRPWLWSLFRHQNQRIQSGHLRQNKQLARLESLCHHSRIWNFSWDLRNIIQCHHYSIFVNDNFSITDQ